MNENEKLPEWIDRFNNKDLHGKELSEFLELMKQNPELRREVKLDAELNELLSDTELLEFRKKIVKYKIPKESNRNGLPIFLLAASVTILISLSILAFLWMRNNDEAIMKADYTYNAFDTSLVTKKTLTDDEQIEHDRVIFDSISSRRERGEIATNDKSLQTDNYIPYAPYESMVGEVSRSVNFKLVKPSASDIFRQGSVITFKWETTSLVALTIHITDNKGHSLFLSQPITGEIFLYNTSKLAQGLYYVKFIYKDEIVYFGKFTLQSL